MADTNTTGSSVDKPIENLEVNGTKYVIMPKKDNNGNVIVDTYATKTELSNEINARKSADSTLQANINTEASTRESADDTLQKHINDEISARESADNTLAKKFLPLAGGTMTGSIQYVNNGKVFAIGNTVAGNVDLGWNWDNREGAGLGLRSADYSSPGEFMLFARDANNVYSLTGEPDGSLTWGGQPLLPVGIVQAFAGTTIPNGWLLCDGSAVSRTDYAALYAVIGTTYGAGNGSTTFNLPNLVDKFVEGSATAGTVKSAGLPNITGSFQTRYPWAGAAEAATGAFKSPPTTESSYTQGYASDKVNYNTVSFSANKSNSIYGNSSTVQPPALTMRYIIKH